jgi:hypothetical protein
MHVWGQVQDGANSEVDVGVRAEVAQEATEKCEVLAEAVGSGGEPV